MTNKHKTGEYLILLFDKYGTKQETLSEPNSLLAAKKKGEEMIKTPPYASYVIIRVLKNSVDNANPWR